MTLLEGANFTNEKQIQLSMRGAGVMKCIGGDTMAVGGSDCIIDIFSNSLRIMTLIPWFLLVVFHIFCIVDEILCFS